jgi:hypothetical protein
MGGPNKSGHDGEGEGANAAAIHGPLASLASLAVKG